MIEDPSKRKGLGRGLSALLGDGTTEDYPVLDRGRPPRELPIEYLRPNPNQPRKHFDEESLEQLADSILEKGLLQPLLVRKIPQEVNVYEIVAGERRWRAAQKAHLHQVPVIIRALGDREVLEISLIENIQRQDLSPIEEANGYQRLIEEFGYSQEQLAQSVGKSRPHVSNLLRLLSLPESIQHMLNMGQLSAGHARALIGNPDAERLAKDIVERGLTVRDAERMATNSGKRTSSKSTPAEPQEKDADTLALEHSLSAALGLTVNLRHSTNGGELRIRYSSLDQLEDLLHRLLRQEAEEPPPEEPLHPGDAGNEVPPASTH
ncbi:MAG TPA: ParB/RepB/Spo0J family partition protein [Candidatus Cybelea sp.]|nr:ParB/RepB/Spo0J family partition protein [Candidatus Cybelea sp.]